jgi:hypothetical protein
LSTFHHLSLVVGSAAIAVGEVVAALGLVTIPAAASAVVPLSLKSASSSLKPPLSPSLPLMDEGPNISSFYLPRFSSATVVPKYSFKDQMSKMIAEVFQAVSDSRSGHLVTESLDMQKLPQDTHADDRFLREHKFNNNVYNNAVNLLTFYPKHLTFVHMAIFADVIHKHLLYALFQRQCYWFTCTFFYTAQIIDCQLQDLDRGVGLDNLESDICLCHSISSMPSSLVAGREFEFMGSNWFY